MTSVTITAVVTGRTAVKTIIASARAGATATLIILLL